MKYSVLYPYMGAHRGSAPLKRGDKILFKAHFSPPHIFSRGPIRETERVSKFKVPGCEVGRGAISQIEGIAVCIEIGCNSSLSLPPVPSTLSVSQNPTSVPATVTFKVSLPFVRAHKYISSPTIHRHISQLFIHGIPKVSLLPFHFAAFLLSSSLEPFSQLARSLYLGRAFCVWLVSLSRFVFQHRLSENRPMFRIPILFSIEISRGTNRFRSPCVHSS